MTARLGVLPTEALKRGASKRAARARRLLASLDADEGVAEAWQEEPERRIAGGERGQMGMATLADAPGPGACGAAVNAPRHLHLGGTRRARWAECLRALGLALGCACAAGPLPAQPLTVAAPPVRHVGTELDGAMPKLAQDLLEVFRDDDRARFLGTVFRLQLAAGQPAHALASIEALRALRGDAPSAPPVFLQHELCARAQAAQAQDGTPFATAWRAAFARRFGALPDAVAWRAEPGLWPTLPRLKSELDAALAQLGERRQLSLAEAIGLVRAWQLHDCYTAFAPSFDAALKEDDARRYAIDRDALVRMPDGAQVAALVVRPRAAAPLPTLFTFTIYANDDWAWADAKRAAAHGYAGVVAYTRGKGRSPDAIVPYAHDGDDAGAVIDWVAAQPWSDGRVGMYGGSYSAFTGWSTLRRPPPALKALATSASTAPGIDVPMEGGVFLNFIYPWPFYVTGNRALDEASYGDHHRWAALDARLYASGRAYRDLPALDGQPNPLFSRWLQHPGYDAYWQRLIPQGAAYAGIDIPVLATTGYFDGAQIGVLHYLREHLRHRPGADHRLLIGPFEHFSMQTGVPPEVQGYATDPAARIDLQGLRMAWFDHVLKGAPLPALLADRVNWQVMGADLWRHAPSLAAMSTHRKRLYLVPGTDARAHRLATQPQPARQTRQRVDWRDRRGADWRAPTQAVLQRLDARAGLVFESAPLAQARELAGELQGRLDFIVNKRDLDVVLSVYERTAQGEYLELAYWLQRASYAQDRRTRRLLRAGQPQQLRVRDARLLGRRLAPGSRLVVTLGISHQPDRQLNLGSGKEPAEETLRDAGAPLEVRWRGSSHLDVPWRRIAP